MYLLLKLLHVVAVVAFLGNITTGLFWHSHAVRTRDPRLLAHTLDGIIRSDRFFTVPGVVGIVVTGVAAALRANLPILGTDWILWSLVLFSISGVVFMLRLHASCSAASERAVRPRRFGRAVRGVRLRALSRACRSLGGLGCHSAVDAGRGARAHGAETKPVGQRNHSRERQRALGIDPRARRSCLVRRPRRRLGRGSSCRWRRWTRPEWDRPSSASSLRPSPGPCW